MIFSQDQIKKAASQMGQNKVDSSQSIPYPDKGQFPNDSSQRVMDFSSPQEEFFHVEPENLLIEQNIEKSHEKKPQCESNQVSNKSKIRSSSESSITSYEDVDYKNKQPSSEYQQNYVISNQVTSGLLARTFEQQQYVPENDTCRQTEKLQNLHLRLQNQSTNQQMIGILRAIDKQIRILKYNWEFNKINYKRLLKNLLKTLKKKTKNADNKRPFHEQIKTIIFYLENLLCREQDEQQVQLGNYHDYHQQKMEIKQQNGQSYSKFAYASFFNAEKSILITFCDYFEKFGNNCGIKVLSRNGSPEGAPNYIVIYHDNKFEELLKVISQNIIKFDSRQPSLMLITHYLKLIERDKDTSMKDIDLQVLLKQLKREYPEQTLSLWQFLNENQQLEYYISTDTRESRVYIYIIMTYFKKKSCFENPKDLEKLSKEERERRFKKIYPS